MNRIKLFFAIIPTMLVMNSEVFSQDNYFQFGSLNHGSVNVSTWTKLNTGTHTFTKSQNDTEIEVYVNSRFRIESLTANGVQFQVRIDDVTMPDFDNLGSIRTADTQEFQSIFAVFENIPAGTHTVSIWAEAAPSGSATGVLVDPGGWGGKIIVKVVHETLVSVEPEDQVVPDEFIVQQNYPNPFNPETTIEYAVQQSSQVELQIYNTLGQLVKTLVDDYKTTGEYSVVWDGKDNFGQAVPSGNYFYQIKMGEFISAKKMILLK
jgi:hypothetical protein